MSKKEVKKEAKSPELAAEIKIKRVAKNLVIMVNKNKFVVPNPDPKDEKTITNKIIAYNKAPTKARLEGILDIIDITTKEEQIVKDSKKAIKKVLEKDVKAVKGKVAEKKIVVRKIVSKIKKASSKKKSIDYSTYLTHDKLGNLVMKGCEEVPMPEMLVKRIEEFLDKDVDIKPLLNFWSLCLLNPNEIARTKLFNYLQHNGIMITPSGYFVTYRMVKTTGDKEIFTDAKTHRMRYVPGTVCRIPREECDEDGNVSCSKGLHTGSPKFIGIMANKKNQLEEGKGTIGDGYGVKYVTTKEANYDSYGTGYDSPKVTTEKFNNAFGNQAIICLVNPQHVVSIPNQDERKLRSCEFYFAKLTTAEEVIDMVEKDYLLFDLDYQNFELKDLQELLKDKTLKAYVDENSEISAKVKRLYKQLDEKRADIKLGNDNIASSLDLTAIKQIVKQRLITIKNE